ncbi:MAG: hypothetical protein IAX21_11420 [Candidatus Bathyarchaeota archaeon]|nr:hypothetical protein [Candidatus Bathyarchaeum tardum]WNZ29216.1 MAG: hypothetical protein IAX21_11420 [Candidatus Bathyarchaeota archaeon]
MTLKKREEPKLRLLFLCLLLVVIIAATVLVLPKGTETKNTYPVDPYFGVSFCGDTPEEAMLLIDKIKDYTNLLVIQSGPVSKNETATNIICDYAADAGLDFIVFFGWFDPRAPWQIPWLTTATETWGEQFLGVYLFDEPGGIQLDDNWPSVFLRVKQLWPELYEDMEKFIPDYPNQTVNRDYNTVKNNYIEYIQEHLKLKVLNNQSITAFTSDYALYYFDYLAGYDTVFVELGWEHDSEKHIALGRGAAKVQQKDWGTIIVWNNLDPNNITQGEYKSASEMLDDMMISYEAGADFIIIFNYPTNPPGNPYGILTEEHFEAMKQFWRYMQQNPEEYSRTVAETALVLPEDYGWGMRSIDDRIWGYWGPDEHSEQIWNRTQELLEEYGLALDIVYNDPNFPLDDLYSEIVYWNSTG